MTLLLRRHTEKMAGFSDIERHAQESAPPKRRSSIANAARRPSASPPLGLPGFAAGCQAKVSRCTQDVPSGTKRRRKSAAVTAPAIGESAEFASPTLNDVFIQITGRNIDKEQAEGGFMEKYAKYD